MMEQLIAQQQAAAGGPGATGGSSGAGRAAGAAAGAALPVGEPLEGFDENDPSTWGNPGRNELCPCGSGKKFKHCHGRI